MREGTLDYEWQYPTFLRHTCICPTMIFIDADPGATIATEFVFKGATIRCCIWHIYKNLRKNLAWSPPKQPEQGVLQRLRYGSIKLSEKTFITLHTTPWETDSLNVHQKWTCSAKITRYIGRHDNTILSLLGTHQHNAAKHKIDYFRATIGKNRLLTSY
jgi:hypothetical protein